jgi:hypothetical protein
MMTMRHFACTLAALVVVPAAVLAEPLVVVELYTSQGCSSCPPADDYFATLVDDPSVIPLAMHVDYWDYIGWKDTFSDPAFTARQHAYARAFGTRTVYTPQMIVGGVDRIEGHNPEAIDALIRMHLAHDTGVSLDVIRTGDTLAIAADGAAGPLQVAVVRYLPQEDVAIKRGENAGRTISYHNIVTDWDVVGEWSGKAPLAMEAVITGDAPVVVILQKPGPLDIVAAARP